MKFRWIGIFMSKVIRFDNIDINTISDELLAEIEKYMLECFHKELIRKGEDFPIFKAKEYSILAVAEKYNLPIEKAKEIVGEIQLRNLDRNLGLK
jgi:hypothetical protein